MAHSTVAQQIANEICELELEQFDNLSIIICYYLERFIRNQEHPDFGEYEDSNEWAVAKTEMFQEAILQIVQKHLE